MGSALVSVNTPSENSFIKNFVNTHGQYG